MRQRRGDWQRWVARVALSGEVVWPGEVATVAGGNHFLIVVLARICRR